MDLMKNYYLILGIEKTSIDKEIKKAYYSLSKQYHPDLNKNEDAKYIFTEICSAYEILISDKRVEYDIKSKWGLNYDESSEYLNFEFNNLSKGWDESKFEDWKKDNQLNILVYIDDKFNGTVEFERWVSCKVCNGSGKDTKSKIEIKDENGNLVKLFDGEDGCDMCEGKGKDWKGNDCYYCVGQGVVGLSVCKTCNGEKRILGKQKLSKIKIPKKQKTHKINSMGHMSKYEVGKVGVLWLIRKPEY
jgi:DnaJ-class molecular chaperone